MIIVRKNLRSLPVAGGELGRVLVTVGSEPVVLFRKSHPILEPKFNDQEWDDFASTLQVGPDLAEQADAWNCHDRFAFNCHTLAIGRLLGVGPDYWLEGSRSIFTLKENPAQVLLDAYFQEIHTTVSVNELAEDLHAGDIVVFRHSGTGDLVHSGIVQDDQGQGVILSKLGEHPVAWSTVDVLAMEYRHQFDTMQLYRPKQERLGRPRLKQAHRPLRVVTG